MQLIITLLLFALPAGAGNGLRRERVVLSEALIRAGGPGGKRSVSNETLRQLCERGVRAVYYLYPNESFSNRGMHECGRGALSYKGGGLRPANVRIILEDIAESLERRSGPVLVHCWNGSHAAGEISAYALMQFCGLSGEDAAAYWVNTIHDRQNLPRYGKVLARIRSFQPYLDLRLRPESRPRVCP